MRLAMHLEQRDKRFICLSTAGVIFAALVFWFLFPKSDLLLLFVLIFPLLLATQIRLYRGILEQFDELSSLHCRMLEDNYRQVESLFSLFSLLPVKAPLPPMRIWAISPDFANVIVEAIQERKPSRVLELGSGVSTLVAAYALRENSGVLISLEHEKRFAEITENNLKRHGLSDLVRVVHAPLRQVELQGRTQLWYDTQALLGLEDIELVIVDGPPGKVHELARYPALPLLWSILGEEAVILIDDANRPDEREMIELWCREFAPLQAERIATEKGSVILRKRSEAKSGSSLRSDRLRSDSCETVPSSTG